MKTSSLWGTPPKRFYDFIRRVASDPHPCSPSFAVLGCSDGKFVLPLARRGYKVLAVDIDEVALFGGEKQGISGTVRMPGLIARLEKEGLRSLVDVVHGDFVDFAPPAEHQGVFTSGAIQYSYNLRHRISSIISSIQSYVAPGGYLYADYMLPLEEQHQNRENYLRPGELKPYFPIQGWEVLYDRVLPPVMEKPHVDNPVEHYHHWGHLCARRCVAV